jgi:hypothetical protein
MIAASDDLGGFVLLFGERAGNNQALDLFRRRPAFFSTRIAAATFPFANPWQEADCD